jgi:drug/metabolite transporter (DMT)-like permease
MFIFSALTSYFLGALTVIMDKFLLGSKRISSAPIYSFYIGVSGMFVLAFIPFGFYLPSAFQIAVSLISGFLFSLGILALYFAIRKGEASRVSPIVGATIPVVTFILSWFFSAEKLVLVQIIGIALLIFGGLLISFDLPLKINKKKFSSGFYPSLLAGFLLALSYFGFKFVYQEQSFLNGFIWTRFGAFLAVASYFIVPSWRKSIFKSFRNFKKPQKQEYQTGIIFIGNKALGGISSILINYAIALGSVTVVNSLVSSQYVFILALAYFAHKKFPFVFEEKLYFWDWAQKLGAIVLIGIGIVLIY